MIRSLIVIVIFLNTLTLCLSQENLYFINRGQVDSVPDTLNYYALTYDGLISCEPGTKVISDQENGFEGKIIWLNQEALLIIARNDDLVVEKGEFFESHFDSTSQFTLNSNEYLFSRMINLEDEKYKIFSLFVWDSLSNTETEIFRNCRELVKNSMQYFGCGSLPFIVQYYGDLTNDGIPELLITADKEAGVLKLLIGKVNGSYKVIWSYDS